MFCLTAFFLLPKSFPPYPERNDVDLHATLVPAKEVGGDLYDFYIRDEKMFFCIGDVSGKGIPASLVMAITRTLFRNVSARESKPHSIVSAMNNTLAEDNQNNFFVTLFVGVLDLPTGVLSYCNAGHEPPIIINETATPLRVDSNLPIGAISQWHYTMQEITITPHTTIFLYTDGVTEAKDAAHNQFGRQRMLRELTSNANPKTIVDNMTAAIHSFVGGARQSDDITMMAVCYNRQERAVRLNRSLTLTNDVSNIPELTKFVNEVCREVDFNNSKTKQVRLAMEEAVVNVIDYAYPHGTTGKIYIEEARNCVAKAGHLPMIHVTDFISNMATAYSAADLVISRAGAGSISEFCLLQKPVILVPSPNVAEDHQTKNAMALVNKNAALYVKDVEAGDLLIDKAIEAVNQTELLNNLSKNIAELAFTDSANVIAKEVITLAKNYKEKHGC